MSHEHNLKIVSECFSDFRFSALYKLDSLYNYRIDCLNEIIVNGSYSMIAEELYYCIKSVNMPVVLIGSNKRLVVELKRKLSGLTVIVPDYCDRLNRDILYVGLNHRDYYSEMSRYADVMYVSENAKEKKNIIKQYPDKVREAFPTSDNNDMHILEGDDAVIDITPNYIEKDQMFRNAAEIFKESLKY